MLALGACGEAAIPSTGSATFPLTIANCDRQVSIKERPERILTNGPDALNLVAAAGGADRVVARASEFGQELRGPAAEAARAQLLDANHDLSTEVVINTRAQLLVSNPDYLADPGVVDQLSQAGIPTLFGSGYCEGQRADLDDVYADIELLGRLFGTEDRAAKSVADLRNRVAAFQAERGNRPARTAVQAQIYENVIYAAAGRSIEQTQLEILGLQNIFADSDDQFIEPALEELIKRDPEVLILQYGFAEVTDNRRRSSRPGRSSSPCPASPASARSGAGPGGDPLLRDRCRPTGGGRRGHDRHGTARGTSARLTAASRASGHGVGGCPASSGRQYAALALTAVSASPVCGGRR